MNGIVDVYGLHLALVGGKDRGRGHCRRRDCLSEWSLGIYCSTVQSGESRGTLGISISAFVDISHLYRYSFPDCFLRCLIYLRTCLRVAFNIGLHYRRQGKESESLEKGRNDSMTVNSSRVVSATT